MYGVTPNEPTFVNLDLFDLPLANAPQKCSQRILRRHLGSTEQSLLEKHSWDFAESKSSRASLHAIHPYPTKVHS